MGILIFLGILLLAKVLFELTENKKKQDMSYLDIGNPAYEDDFEHECSVCGKAIEDEGYCSNTCFQADMR